MEIIPVITRGVLYPDLPISTKQPSSHSDFLRDVHLAQAEPTRAYKSELSVELSRKRSSLSLVIECLKQVSNLNTIDISGQIIFVGGGPD